MSEKKEIILVTGSNGYLGYRLAKGFAETFTGVGFDRKQPAHPRPAAGPEASSAPKNVDFAAGADQVSAVGASPAPAAAARDAPPAAADAAQPSPGNDARPTAR